MTNAVRRDAVYPCANVRLMIGPVPVAHVIVVIQENRTTDNLFASSMLANGGPFPGADVTQTATIDGKQVQLKPIPFEYPDDPDHSHRALLAQWNGGKMDGWAQDKIYSFSPELPKPSPAAALGYVPAAETTIYHVLAHRYAWADENFSPRLVPTFPGHLLLVTGTTPAAEDPTDPINWGCDSVPGTTVALFGAGESEISPGEYPCFDGRTIGDLLDAKRVSWKYYTAAVGTRFDAYENPYDAIKHVRYGLMWNNLSMPMSNVLDDIAACRLPQVAYVTPTWMNSDHAGELTNGGPAWVGSIYMAILQSEHSADPACRYYGNTTMLVTWDDSGGWFDHVAPPPGPDGTRWGFRVPIVAISPYAKPGYVSHVRRETTSIMTFIEKRFDLGNLGQRDATDDDLSELFDYTQTPIPPLPDITIARLIRQYSPGWDLATSLRDAHAVDDE